MALILETVTRTGNYVSISEASLTFGSGTIVRKVIEVSNGHIRFDDELCCDLVLIPNAKVGQTYELTIDYSCGGWGKLVGSKQL